MDDADHNDESGDVESKVDKEFLSVATVGGLQSMIYPSVDADHNASADSAIVWNDDALKAVLLKETMLITVSTDKGV